MVLTGEVLQATLEHLLLAYAALAAGILVAAPLIFFSLYTVLHQLDQKIIYSHYDFKHLTEKYFEIGMKLNDFSIQLVKYC